MNQTFSFYELQSAYYYDLDLNFVKSLKISYFHREFPSSKDSLFNLAEEYENLERQDLSIPILKKILLLDTKQVSSNDLFNACYKVAKSSIRLKYIGLFYDMISMCKSYLKILDGIKYVSTEDSLSEIQSMEQQMKIIIEEASFEFNPDKSIAQIEGGKIILQRKNCDYKKAESYFVQSLSNTYSEEAIIYLALCKMKQGNYKESLLYSKIYLGLINIYGNIIEEDRLKASIIYIKSLIELGFYEMAQEEILFFQSLSQPNSNSNLKSKYQKTFDKYLNTCKYLLSEMEKVISSLPKSKINLNYAEIIKELSKDLKISASDYKISKQLNLISTKWVQLWENFYTTIEKDLLSKSNYSNDSSMMQSQVKESFRNGLPQQLQSPLSLSLNLNLNLNSQKKMRIHNSNYKNKLDAANIDPFSPGPIFNIDLIKYQKGFNDPVEIFANLNLKPVLEESKEYIVVSEIVWNKLYSYFGGMSILRYLTNYFNPPILEIYLFPIKWSLYSNNIDYKGKFSSVYVTLLSSTVDLLNKICRIINHNNLHSSKLYPNQIILWKLKNKTSSTELLKIIKSRETFPASQIKDTKFIKEKTLGKNEKILVEIVPNGLSSLFILIPRFEKFTQSQSFIELQKIKNLKKECKDNISINDIIAEKSIKFKFIIEKRNNNCYMDCILECLSHSRFFVQKILNLDIPSNLYLSNAQSLKGRLSLSLFKYILDFWLGPVIEGTRRLQSFEIKHQLSKKYEIFRENKMEDALEFLYNLMNELHEDFNRNSQNRNSQNLDLVGVEVKEKETEKEKENEKKKEKEKTWQEPMTLQKYKFLNNSFISELFFGECLQVTTCLKCSSKTEIFENFSTLNLSIPFKFKIEVYLLRSPTSRIEYYAFYVKQDSTINHLSSIMNMKLHLENYQSKLKFVSILLKQKIIEFTYNNFSTCISVKKNKGILFAYLVPSDKVEYLEYFTFLNIEYSNVFTSHIIESDFPRVLFVEKSTTNLSVVDNLKELIKNIRNQYKEIFGIQNLSENRNNSLNNNNNNDNLNNFPEFEVKITCRVKHDRERNLLQDIKFPPLYSNYVQFQQFIESNNITTCVLDAQFSINNQRERERVYKHLNSFISYSTSNEETIKTTLEKCIKKFQKIEKLDSNNLGFCTKCNEKLPLQRQINITKFPPNLIICLKRSIVLIGNNVIKNETILQFPTNNLILNQYSKGMEEQLSYNLFGIVNHTGDHSYESFYALCKNFGNSWIKFIPPLSEEVNDISSLNSPDAYLLFYSA